MKILGFAGSNSKKSINKALVQYTLSGVKEHETELLDLNDFDVAIYSPEREKMGIPDPILSLAEKISNADLIILSLAEHNGSYTAAFKNIYDWISRIPNRKVWDNTNIALMSATPGGRGGQSVLEAATNRFPRDGATIVATFSLPNFQSNFDGSDAITHPELLEKHQAFLFSALSSNL